MTQDGEKSPPNDGRAAKACGLGCFVLALGCLMNYGRDLAGGSELMLIVMAAVVSGLAAGVGGFIGTLIDRWWASRK